MAKANEVKVIECNLRASRSFPFASKVTGYNFIDIATKRILGIEYTDADYKTLDLDHVGVKAPQFSFSRLKGADPVLGVEMASTGEVACFGDDLKEAFMKAFIAVGFRIPKKNVLFSVGKLEDKADLLESAEMLSEKGYKLFGTQGTAKFLGENGVYAEVVAKASESEHRNMLDVIESGDVDMVINIPKSYSHQELTDGYAIRRKAIDYNVPLITNVQIARLLAESLCDDVHERLEVNDWASYI